MSSKKADNEEMIITDIRIPYVSLVVLFIKSAIALIPATVILLILIIIFDAITAGQLLRNIT